MQIDVNTRLNQSIIGVKDEMDSITIFSLYSIITGCGYY